jgi:hypothetical protein
MLSEVLTDILDHTHGLGFIEVLKITKDAANKTKLEAMHHMRAVVMYGELKTPLSEITDTIGLSRMAVLQGYLKFPPFTADKATIEIISQQRAGVDTPTEIQFTSPDGHEANYRFMHKDAVDSEIKVPTFKGATWDVTVVPTAENLKELSYFNGVLGAYEPTFLAKTDGTELNLYIGSGPTDRATVPFAKGVSGSLAGKFSFPLIETLAILKLAAKADNCTMSFSDKGVLRILLSTAVCNYEFIIPAKM